MESKTSKASEKPFHPPVWDRGDPIDGDMLRFTIGDDWFQDRRLVAVDIQGSLAHADGLLRAGLIGCADHSSIRAGLEALLAEHARGEWDVEPGDEDVHSAVERRLILKIGDAGERLHTGRSRNDQVATDMRLWLRGAVQDTDGLLGTVAGALLALAVDQGDLPLPGYTHLRRGMPSSIAHWALAHRAALEADRADLDGVSQRIARCPLGSGAGYGVPLDLDRTGVAKALGFEGPEEPVTLAQHSRGRAELAYVTVLESIALDLGKLAADLWLFSSAEFGFLTLPAAMTTGSSLMPHKRNPDLVELIRGGSRQVVADRAALLDVLRDLPSGYHRDFQLVKPPLFRAHDRVHAMLPLVARLLVSQEWNVEALKQAADDPDLARTAAVLERARGGETFRSVYREESRQAKGAPTSGVESV